MTPLCKPQQRRRVGQEDIKGGDHRPLRQVKQTFVFHTFFLLSFVLSEDGYELTAGYYITK